jgi:hypothetical protein
MKISATQIPDRRTVEQFLQHVRLARSAGREPVAPASIEEVLALKQFPRLFSMYRPGKNWLKLAGHEGVLDDPEPFDVVWRERFFATLEVDPEFSRAVAMKLGVK